MLFERRHSASLELLVNDIAARQRRGQQQVIAAAPHTQSDHRIRRLIRHCHREGRGVAQRSAVQAAQDIADQQARLRRRRTRHNAAHQRTIDIGKTKGTGQRW